MIVKKVKGNSAVRLSTDTIDGYENMGEMMSGKSMMKRWLKIEKGNNLGKGKTK